MIGSTHPELTENLKVTLSQLQYHLITFFTFFITNKLEFDISYMSFHQDFLEILAKMELKVVLVPLVSLVTRERWGNQVTTPTNQSTVCMTTKQISVDFTV